MAGMGREMEMAAMSGMEGMGGAWTLTELGCLCVMRSIMMVALMLPSAAPTILLVARVQQSRRERQGDSGPHGST